MKTKTDILREKFVEQINFLTPWVLENVEHDGTDYTFLFIG